MKTRNSSRKRASVKRKKAVDSMVIQLNKLGIKACFGLAVGGNAIDLAKFFSPHDVPRGLTQEQMSKCISFSQLRKWQRTHGPTGPGLYQKHVVGAPLPEEFSTPHIRMTRKRFDAGMKKFLQSVLEVIQGQLAEMK